MPSVALRVLPGCALAIAAFTAPAGRAQYALDSVHTRVLFAVSHAGFSQALGTVSGSTGMLDFDPENLRGARVQASVPLARLELGDEKWNAAARKLLRADTHPVATFVSTRVEPVDASHATVIGTLTLNGIAQEVRLAVTFNQLRRHPLPPFRRTAGFSATTTLSRRAFGITAWPSVIGDAVELRIEAEAVRSRGGTAEPADDAGPEILIDLPPTPATDASSPAPASGPPAGP